MMILHFCFNNRIKCDHNHAVISQRDSTMGKPLWNTTSVVPQWLAHDGVPQWYSTTGASENVTPGLITSPKLPPQKRNLNNTFSMFLICDNFTQLRRLLFSWSYSNPVTPDVRWIDRRDSKSQSPMLNSVIGCLVKFKSLYIYYKVCSSIYKAWLNSRIFYMLQVHMQDFKDSISWQKSDFR